MGLLGPRNDTRVRRDEWLTIVERRKATRELEKEGSEVAKIVC